ncbi:MAG: PEP-CTERM sorting domain-containing protein [Abditibacteriota bacterium]|nr:PEP-CTERM sorting domain-containing protein [Abditibacteriota bacterium]
MAASAFAGVTIGNWGVNDGDFSNPRIYDGLMTDIAPAGFTVHATSGVFGGESAPFAMFQSNTISPGWMVFYDTTEFEVSVTGFDGLFIDNGTPAEGRDLLYVSISAGDPASSPNVDTIVYKTAWNGDGVYKFGREQAEAFNPRDSLEAASIYVTFMANGDGNDRAGYRIGDNTQGTVEFIFPDSEVPEPSTLLALAFGGAGTALAIRRRK